MTVVRTTGLAAGVDPKRGVAAKEIERVMLAARKEARQAGETDEAALRRRMLEARDAFLRGE